MTQELAPSGTGVRQSLGVRRHKGVRVIFTLLLWVTLVAFPISLSLYVDDQIGWPLALRDAMAVGTRLSPMVALFFLSPKVSYRRRDCLMYLVPLYGVLVFPFIIFWRIVRLPLRDWPSRPDERHL
ncbi:hypothetical protein OG320_23755 [Microbispora sp. NBC_01189]|uniref:hypothetical protein n=1 Tax=Microbispora sp. NBC_01189 TaxID=2903583 RepID=UPI002E1164D3|nr:hypothetical protein OG320_23755 [Microbispora sp. NBC_01189]